MSHIIAARFETFPEAERSARRLEEAGIVASDMNIVYVNPPGQHATYAIGGDQEKDKGASEADIGAKKGAILGGSIGAIVGAAVAVSTVPLVAPAAVIAAAGVGAYGGSLAGTLSRSGNDERNARVQEKAVRSAGVLLAVNVGSGHPEQRVIDLLRENGGEEIEVAEGDWLDGRWASFNPLDAPKLIDRDGNGAAA